MTLLSPRTALSQTGFSSLAFCVALALLAGCATSAPSTGIDEEDEGRPRFDTDEDEEDTDEEDPEADVQGGDDADAGETPDIGEPSDVEASDTTPDDTGAADTGTDDAAEDTGTAVDTGTPADTGGTDTGSSACPTIPVCTLAATRCDGALLETCLRNAAGCAEWTSRDCGDTIPGGLCDDTLLPAVCVEPPDLCEGLPNLCSTPGPACDGARIVNCAANADGCLVTTTTTDCAAASQTCAGTPPACVTPVCGDGAINRAGETCDDDNTDPGDGCSASCTVEDSYTCVGEPSVCTTELCGNGRVDAGEDCDDRNDVEGDGCSRECLSEPAFPSCSGGITRHISCETGRFTANTNTGASNYSSYTTSCGISGYGGREHVMVFQTAEVAFVTMSLVGSPSTADVDLLVLQPGSSPGCSSNMTCVNFSDEAATDEFLTFVAEPGRDYVIVADAISGSSAYTFEADCSTPFCGDGSTIAPLCEQPIELESGEIYVVESTITTTDTSYQRPISCSRAGTTSSPYDAYTFTNPTSAPMEVLASASWPDFDGYLVAYSTFNSAAPTANCLAVNDDTGGTSGSEVIVTVPAGGSVTFVATTYGSGGRGDYRLVVVADP